MKAIITGITGQDGSHLADLLLEKNYEVVGVSRRCSVDTTERISHLSCNDKFKLVEGDITDTSSVMNVFKDNDNVDEVYNLAAQSHVASSFKQPGLTWDITGKGCLNLLQSLVDLKMNHVKFYQASSSEMFGSSYDVDDNGGKYLTHLMRSASALLITAFVYLGMLTTFMLVLVFYLITKDQEGVRTLSRRK